MKKSSVCLVCCRKRERNLGSYGMSGKLCRACHDSYYKKVHSDHNVVAILAWSAKRAVKFERQRSKKMAKESASTPAYCLACSG